MGLALTLYFLGSDSWELGDLLLFGIFAILFWGLAFGFNHAFVGFLVRLGRLKEPVQDWAEGTPDADERVALVMPIFNEPVERVFEGLKATFDSVNREDAGDCFDVFILSDTDDEVIAAREVAAFLRWRTEEGLEGRIHYRRRKQRAGRKAGNVADFCERWGDEYEYMVVLDADSVMTGRALVTLLRRMNGSPGLALLQTVPRIVGGRTWYARAQQFAAAAYGPTFLAALEYWQEEGGNFWGHNAIIRIEPFRRHCALPLLPGPGIFGGEVLSHDFVEAGLLRAAGWEVRLARDLVGSYEEGPQSIIEAAKRDRRWCEGNLQHVLFLFAKGFRSRTRVHLSTGILGYISSPLWLLLIIASFFLLGWRANGGFGEQTLPGILLLLWTAFMLFVPKLLCFLDRILEGRAKRFGGIGLFANGVVAETLMGFLLAPINMWFHTQFVIANLIGKKVRWNAQNRNADKTEWSVAWSVHRNHVVLGGVLLLLGWLMGGEGALAFICPVSGPLLLSPVISRLTSHAARQRLFTIPEETAPVPEVTRALAEEHPFFAIETGIHELFERVVVEPRFNACYLAGLPEEEGTAKEGEMKKILQKESGELEEAQILKLLASSSRLNDLHLAVWEAADDELHESWVERRDRD